MCMEWRLYFERTRGACQLGTLLAREGSRLTWLHHHIQLSAPRPRGRVGNLEGDPSLPQPWGAICGDRESPCNAMTRCSTCVGKYPIFPLGTVDGAVDFFVICSTRNHLQRQPNPTSRQPNQQMRTNDEKKKISGGRSLVRGTDRSKSFANGPVQIIARDMRLNQISLCSIPHRKFGHRLECCAGQKDDCRFRIVGTWNQLCECLEPRHIRQRQFQHHAIDPLRPTDRESCGSSLGFEDDIIRG